jgi:hypothetical protein
MRKNAQAISEYLVLITVIAAALGMMQLYFRRSIQAVVKIAADEVGSQKQGAADYDYDFEWKERQNSLVNTTSSSTDTETKLSEASVIYGKNETTRQRGVMSFGVVWEKE